MMSIFYLREGGDHSLALAFVYLVASALVPLRSLPNDSNPYKLQLCKEIPELLRRSVTFKYSFQERPSRRAATQQQPRYYSQQSLYGPLSGTTRVSHYQKKPTHHPDHHPIFINFFHLLQSIASSLFTLHAWQSFCTTSLHVLFILLTTNKIKIILTMQNFSPDHLKCHQTSEDWRTDNGRKSHKLWSSCVV